jgi:hypothetical protein
MAPEFVPKAMDTPSGRAATLLLELAANGNPASTRIYCDVGNKFAYRVRTKHVYSNQHRARYQNGGRQRPTDVFQGRLHEVPA